MSHGTNILFNISLFKLSEWSPSWVFNVTEILESLICVLKLEGNKGVHLCFQAGTAKNVSLS